MALIIVVVLLWGREKGAGVSRPESWEKRVKFISFLTLSVVDAMAAEKLSELLMIVSSLINCMHVQGYTIYLGSIIHCAELQA